MVEMATTTLLINTLHPTLVAAKRVDGSQTDLAFRRLAYEVAFTEYSLYLARLEAERNPAIDAKDMLFEVRSAINRVSKSAAALYRP